MKSCKNNINLIQLIDELKVDNELQIIILEKCEWSLDKELKKITKDSSKEFSEE